MGLRPVRYFHRALEHEAPALEEQGWVEWGRERVLSMPSTPVVLFEREGELPLSDENAVRPVESIGVKHDTGKDRFDLLDPDFERAIVRVLTFGAKEYGDHNFKKVKDPYDRYYAALRRHLNDWRKGEDTDPKTGESHLAHVICNALFLMHFDREKAKER